MGMVEVPEVYLELREPSRELVCVLDNAAGTHSFWGGSSWLMNGLSVPDRWRMVFALDTERLSDKELIWRNGLAVSFAATLGYQIQLAAAADALLDALGPGLYRYGRYHIRLGHYYVDGVEPRPIELRAWTANIMIHEVMV